MPKLSAQDEKYAQLLFKGEEQSKAFLFLRPYASKWKPESVWQNASKWAAKVRPRLDQLQAKLEKKFDLSQERVLEEYAAAGLSTPLDSPTYGDKHVALKAIRDMLGYDAPKKTEDTRRVLSVELKAELKEFTLEELKAMLVGMEDPTLVELAKLEGEET